MGVFPQELLINSVKLNEMKMINFCKFTKK